MTVDERTADERTASLSLAFARFSALADESPLYRAVTAEIANDPEVLAVAAGIRNGPVPNTLLAAVQYLVASDDPLADFYASRVASPGPPADAYPAFRAFVLENGDEILRLGATRRTQTNEPLRAAVLMPFVAAAADRLGEPVHLVEVGASVGLNLCLDRYRYDYGTGHVIGQSELTLRCEHRGGVVIPSRTPFIQRRVGIDVATLDPAEADDVRWLEALVWPEGIERRRRLRQAIKIRRTEQIEMVRADASVAIESVLASLPTSGPAVVWHSFAWVQFDETQRSRFDDAMVRAARSRSIARIGWEFWDAEMDVPEIRIGLASESMTPVARAHPHGEWLEGT